MGRSSRATFTRWTPRNSVMRKILPLIAAMLPASMAFAQAPAASLKVCADPDNLPQSDRAGAGYENKIAEALARDLGRKLEYTYFPQRTGFVRQTLRAQDDVSKQFKCDVIIG